MAKANELYGSNFDDYQGRKEKLIKAYRYHFSEEPDSIFSSSGRIELLGNHTDHNHGKVLVAAVDMDIIAAARPCEELTVTLVSEGYDPMIVNLDDLDAKEEEKGRSIAMIRGVLRGFQDRGYKLGGLHIKAASNIYRGVGVSSSAAFELLIAAILNYYYNDNQISPMELARIGQFAESSYFGKPCGLLDQAGIALGGINYIDFGDIENPIVENLKFHLKGYSIVLVNTGGDHSDLTASYAEIKDDMHAVAKVFGKEYLSDVDNTDFIRRIPALYKRIGGRPILRAMHFIDENKRVVKGFEALKQNDLRAFFDCINRSGDSSYKYLQNCYCPGDNMQGIPLGITLTKRLLKDGAVRVHGGGFAGTILVFVPDQQAKSFFDLMRMVFGENNVTRVQFRDEGATHVETLSGE